MTVFIDLDAADKPVLFVTPGKGKETVAAFRAFMLAHHGEPTRVAEIVCDMSAAFLAAAGEAFPQARVTVDWFHQRQALDELETGGFATAEAYRTKEMLRWVRHARTRQAARWRLTNFLNHVTQRLAQAEAILDPVRQAVATVRNHATRIIERWTSGHTNARLEALNSLFQAARARARGYRNTATFATIIYLIAAPLGDLFHDFKST